MDDDVSRTERQLNLVSALLKAREPLGWADIQKISGYNVNLPKRSLQKRFERDIHDLREIGLTVSAEALPKGERQYSLDRGSCLLAPLKLTPQQRLLLYRVGVSYLEGGDAGPLRDHLSRALVKLQAGSGINALPDHLPPAILRRSLHRRPAEAKHLQTLGLALIERRRVVFDYERPGAPKRKRSVAPYSLVTRRGGWYVVAYDHERKSARTFKLSRIRGEVSFAKGSRPNEFDVPAGFDSEASFSTEPFGAGAGTMQNVRVRFTSDVAFIVENEFGDTHTIERDARGITLCLPQAYPYELLRYLSEFAGHWEIVAPPELRKLVVAELRQSLEVA
ncbi:MAG: WYL domain-containing protein [Planctomycetes bacterium]|nr:WYL domain-containing protein [Planctomycetota bacterium]